MTPYLRFHPGGVPLLLKIAGRDGTALFTKYHAWVSARRGGPSGAHAALPCCARACLQGGYASS